MTDNQNPGTLNVEGCPQGDSTCLRTQEKAASKAASTSPAEPVGDLVGANALEGSADTVKLCREISEKSGGVCFLGFSRGKDSIAAWLWLRQFFTRIIPFHCASVPGLKFVDESLEYYEQVFKTPILRFMDGACTGAVDRLYWQGPDSEETISEMELWHFDKHDILAYLRKEYNLPDAWCAFGINATDSIDRRIWVKKIGGQNPQWKTFYPCYDWPRKLIIDAVQAYGVKLPKDYLLASRTMAAVPSYRALLRMEELIPEDFERIQLMFPLIKAELARMYFRDLKWEGKSTRKACRCKEPECKPETTLSPSRGGHL